MTCREIFRDDAYVRECTTTVIGHAGPGFLVDQTVFYPRAGGQPGDRGKWQSAGSTAPIIDCCRGEYPGEIVHVTPDSAAMPEIGTTLNLALDWPRRHRLMRMHSCLHLLCKAVDGTVTGGNIGDGKGRLDFDIPEATLNKEELGAVINQWIAEDHAISAHWIDEAELERRPELVRTMSVQPPRGQGRIRLVEIDGLDLQACGGTHVRSTREIGRVHIAKIEKKGRQNRRVQVVFDEQDMG